MSIVAFENWALRKNPAEGGYTLNAWASPVIQSELHRLIPEYHSHRETLTGMTGAGRTYYFEYNVPISADAIKPCPAIDGWYFTLPGSHLEDMSFALAFADRKQNPNFPIQSRDDLNSLISEQ